MNIAILIGNGCQVAALLARRDSLSDNFILFRTNVSRATKNNAAYPVIDVFNRERARQTLLSRDVSQIVMVGSLAPTGPHVKGRDATAEFKRLITKILKGEDANDATRMHIRSLLRPDFEFPAAKSVLPFLFRDDIGPRPA